MVVCFVYAGLVGNGQMGVVAAVLFGAQRVSTDMAESVP
jgi:hypothetical protein